MTDAYIVDAIRTAGGKRKGRLSEVHPTDMSATIIDALLERTAVDPEKIDDVIWGCVGQVGPQTFNIARTSILASSLPVSVPGVSVDRQCGSSLQALHFAAQAVMSGNQDMVIAGGVESMTRVPMLSNINLAVQAGLDAPFDSKKIAAKYPGEEFSQFNGAELLARKYEISAEEMAGFAELSHRRGEQASDEGRFANEIIPMQVEVEGQAVIHDRDEGIRPSTTKEAVLALEPLQEGGLVNAGTASQICDGASGVLVVNEKALKEYGLKPSPGL